MTQHSFLHISLHIRAYNQFIHCAFWVWHVQTMGLSFGHNGVDNNTQFSEFLPLYIHVGRVARFSHRLQFTITAVVRRQHCIDCIYYTKQRTEFLFRKPNTGYRNQRSPWKLFSKCGQTKIWVLLQERSERTGESISVCQERSTQGACVHAGHINGLV